MMANVQIVFLDVFNNNVKLAPVRTLNLYTTKMNFKTNLSLKQH